MQNLSDLSREAGVLVGGFAACIQELCEISHDGLQLLICGLGLVLHQLSKSPVGARKARLARRHLLRCRKDGEASLRL